MARKPDPESTTAQSSAPAEVATVAADAVAGPTPTPAAAGADTSTPGIQYGETATDLPVQFDDAFVRAWLESPAGMDWMQDYQLKQVAARPAVDPELGLSSRADERAAVARAVGILPAQVLDWRDHGDRLVVVTVDGRKLEARP